MNPGTGTQGTKEPTGSTGKLNENLSQAGKTDSPSSSERGAATPRTS